MGMKDPDNRIRQLSQEFCESELEEYGDDVQPSGQEGKYLNSLLTQLAAERRSFSLLDIGCGIGYVAMAVKTLFPDADVFGVDISPAIIGRAKELDSQDLIQYGVATESQMPCESERFDFAVCRLSIHHYPRILEHLSEVHRLLKPQGTYLIIDVVPDSGEYDEWLNDLFMGREDGHVKFYTLVEYESLLQQSGYSVRSVEYFPQLLDLSQEHMLYLAIKKMPPEFQEMVSFKEYNKRFSFELKAAGIFAQKTKKNT